MTLQGDVLSEAMEVGSELELEHDLGRAIIDGAVVIYDIEDVPAWLEPLLAYRDEDGSLAHATVEVLAPPRTELQDAAKEMGLTLAEPDPEAERAFDEWLQDPDNKARWDQAIREAQEKSGRRWPMSEEARVQLSLTPDEYDALLLAIFREDAWPDPRPDEGHYQWLFDAERSMRQKLADASIPNWLPDNVRPIYKLQPAPQNDE